MEGLIVFGRCLPWIAALAAIVPPPAGGVPVEIARPQDPISPTTAMEADVTRTLDDLGRATGSSWRAHTINGATGTVHLAYGSGLNLGVGRIQSSEAALAAARAFVAAHPAVFPISTADLEVWDVPRSPGKWGVNFHQTHGGLRVIGGRIDVVMTAGGRVAAFGSDVYSGIDVDRTPALSAATAGEIAARDLGVPSDPSDRVARLMILPVHRDRAVTHHLVWEVDHRTADPVGWWFSYVDAHSGQILWRRNHVYSLDVTGTVTGVVEDFGWCQGPSDAALAHMVVTIQGTGDSDTTALDGGFAIPAGVDPVTLQLKFEGPWLNVNVDAEYLPDSQLEIPATPGVPVDAHWDSLSSRWDERDTFLHGNRVHDYMLALDPTQTALNYSMPCSVGINQTCNAYWDGYGINFFRAGGACANTGRIGDVVYHEYGHGVTWYIYGTPDDQPPSRIGEANSDVIANLIAESSIIGEGFHNECGIGIRDSDNTLCWPRDAQGEGHFDGQMLAGFFWDARENFMASLGEEPGKAEIARVWHFGRKLGKPYELDDQVFWSFVEDDDDGDLDNGTPHYWDLCAAAENHCFACPDFGVEIRHVAVGPLWDPGVTVPVSAKMYSTLGALDPDSLLVRHRTNGGPFADAPLAGSPVDSLYSGDIPAQASGSLLEYYVLGVDEAGNRATDPREAPAALHQVFVDPTFGDDFEADRGWTVGALGDGATEGMWVRVDPVGSWIGDKPVQPEDDHSSDPGAVCFVTGQNVEGGNAHQGDVDEGRTSLVSPLFNLGGATEAQLGYYRWYTDDANVTLQEEYWIVQVRNNGGPWTDLENTTETAPWWTRMSFDLMALFGEEIGNVQVAFRAEDDPEWINIVEAAVDDFWLHTDLGGGTVAVDPVPPGTPRVTTLAGVTPNPLRSDATIRYQLAAESDVVLGIYDVAGRAVRRLVETRQPAGHYALRWDGRTRAGAAVAAGTYFARLQAGERTFARKITVVR
jgi:hypothetical protein